MVSLIQITGLSEDRAAGRSWEETGWAGLQQLQLCSASRSGQC